MSLYFAIPISAIIVFVTVFISNLILCGGDRHGAMHCTLVLMGGALVMAPLLAVALCSLGAMFILLASA